MKCLAQCLWSPCASIAVLTDSIIINNLDWDEVGPCGIGLLVSICPSAGKRSEIEGGTGDVWHPKEHVYTAGTQYTGTLLIIKFLFREGTQEDDPSGLRDPSISNAAISCKWPQILDKSNPMLQFHANGPRSWTRAGTGPLSLVTASDPWFT